MSKIFLVITEPDDEGFSIIEAHLIEDAAQARADAGTAYARTALPCPAQDAPDEEWDAYWLAEASWRAAHPFIDSGDTYSTSYVVKAVAIHGGAA